MSSVIKKRSLRHLLLLLLVTVLCTALSGGCAVRAKAVSTEKKALAYYREKYGLKDVTVIRSYKAGNYGLFGYTGVKDLAFEMSDGHQVYWDDDRETLSDNAQAEEILAAFRQEIIEPSVSAFSCPMKMKDYTLNQTGYDSFDENVFSAFYDGDIRAFLKEEKPEMAYLTIAVQTEDREACEEEITAFFDVLSEYVSGWGDIFILSEGMDALTGSDWELYRSELNVAANAKMYFGETIYWYRQAYIEILDGVFVTSSKSNFVFEEGDVQLEQVGNCAQLQQMLDEGYYALPVDAEENKNGGYMKADQRHEKRVVLDDPDAPLYRLKLSQRVLDELDSENTISVYFLNRRGDGLPMMKYLGEDSGYAYSVFGVCSDCSEEGESDRLNPEYYYYFGIHHSESSETG